LDARISVSDGTRETWRGKVLIDFGAIPFGYAWVFPEARDLSTGVLGAKKKVRGLPGYLERFLNRQGSLSGPRRVTGWPIPIAAWSLNPVGTPRVLLVGDAAGLVDPFTGEGIYYAMHSGVLAAKAILDGGAEAAGRYRRLVCDTFERDFRGARVLAGVIHRTPRRSFRALRRHPGAIEAFADVLTGKLTYVAFLRRVARGCVFRGFRKLMLAA
jgi:flavin-dependent dehydrogenase